MIDEGYLKLHRQIRLWEWHNDPYTLSLFIHLLCMANYLPNYKFRGKVQRVGELHTSYAMLAQETGMHINTVTDRIKKLQSTGEITIKSTNKGLDIFICKYTKYQAFNHTHSTPNVEQDVEQNVEQDVEQNDKTAEMQACTTPSTTLDVEQNVDNQINKEINNNIIKEKNKKRKDKQVSEPSSQADITELEAQFDAFRKAYKGTKRGLKVELDNFKKKNDNWREIIPTLMPALEREIAWREQMQAAGQFVPQWAHLQTWINQSRWETEFETVETATGAASQAKQQPTQQPPNENDYGGSFGGVDY